MSRLIVFSMMIGFAYLLFGVAIDAPPSPGLALDLDTSRAGAGVSPDAMRYGLAGLIAGFVLANLMRISWMDLPRAGFMWLRGQKHRFTLFTLGCLCGGVLLFY